MKDGLQGAENEDQTAWEFAVISARKEMQLWKFEESHRFVRRIPQSRVKELGRVSVVRLVKVPPYSIIVIDGDTSQAGLAFSERYMEDMSAVNTVRYRIHVVKKEYSLPIVIHFSPISRTGV